VHFYRTGRLRAVVLPRQAPERGHSSRPNAGRPPADHSRFFRASPAIAMVRALEAGHLDRLAAVLTAHYFLGSRLLGSTSRHQTWDGVEPSFSRAYFCTKCGDIWGRVAIDNKDWMVLAVGCQKHPEWSAYPGGSFIYSWNRNIINELPDDVLRREFALHWTHYTGIRP